LTTMACMAVQLLPTVMRPFCCISIMM
jgi:hypothetical protein